MQDRKKTGEAAGRQRDPETAELIQSQQDQIHQMERQVTQLKVGDGCGERGGCSRIEEGVLGPRCSLGETTWVRWPMCHRKSVVVC